ncbi:MAG: hypothetical protein DYG98_27055 [Haliscomenobacteraceae bacterium CHB4]|nr:hypothetical protein [Haliscomenobacteraceae bacterium CHB4]
MNKNIPHIDQIEAYLSDQLPPEEMVAMKNAIQADPDLAREVALRRLEFDTSEALIAQNIRDQLSRLRQASAAPESSSTTTTQFVCDDHPKQVAEKDMLPDEQPFGEKQNTRKHRNRLLWLSLGLLLVVAGIIWWMTGKKPVSPEPAIQSQPGMQNTAPAVSDTPARPTPPPPGNTRLQANKPTDGNRLFARHFKPYKDDTLEPLIRGAATPSPSERFQQLYWEDKHREALAVFGTMVEADKNNDNLLFLKANCLLATGQAGEAAALLEQILRNDRTRFMAEARWYLALSYLRSGRNEQARSLLREIQADKESPRQADAERLLGQWK